MSFLRNDIQPIGYSHRKSNIDSSSHYTNIKSRWIVNPRVKGNQQQEQLLESNIELYLHGLR